MIFNNLTKWIPLGEFTFGDCQSIVMVRGNKKTGELFFKTKRVNKAFLGACYPIGKLPIDVSAQWDKIITMLQ